MEDTYFIFGDYAAKVYEETDWTNPDAIQDLAAEIDCEGQLVHFEAENCDPAYVISKYDGWMGWASITKEQYEKLCTLVWALEDQRRLIEATK